jgi:type I restriction-modification system DNA methylase subunit
MDLNLTKEKIQLLIDKYNRAFTAGSLTKYSEEETKKDFIQPLFEALGWEVISKNEVSAEEHQLSGGRVDYGFYLNGRIKFYLEAKALKADLHREEFANQAVRYSWNKGATWAVLTDFESIKIFNAQEIDKSLADKLFFEIPYTQYIERIDQLWLLSKEAFQNNLLDKEAEKFGKKLQKISVTSLLYRDLDKCREILTHVLSQWNNAVNKDLLDEGVQKLLDRLIFLRVAEDRGIEPPTLIPLLHEWNSKGGKVHLYQSMVSKFRELDEVYNSNLFSRHPFEDWEEYGGATEKVINILYGKKGYYEYDFQAMPADVLGSVYENYLGYRLSKSKKGMTLDKDAKKRKEHGIYYTPGYIVDYIVQSTLKPVLDNCHSIEDLKRIKVLDPACGSGSFLIRAMQLIYEKYLELGNSGGIFTKIDILLNNIYGVDLDQQAVEITRLNLLISALSQRKKLPGLDKNIKNGNSLISGTDEELKKYFGANFRDKKPFNWKEKFPEVFEQGGFDVIIGNPPYIFARGGNFDEGEKRYYNDCYKLQEYQLNTYLLFVERAYNLLKQEGKFGFIIPNNWLSISTFSRFREFVLKKIGDVTIINSVEAVFSQANVNTCILMFNKSNPTTITLGELLNGNISQLNKHKPDEYYNNNFVIDFERSSGRSENQIIKKINNVSITLGEIAKVSTGLKSYQEGKGKPIQTKVIKESRKFHSSSKIDETYLRYLQGVDVKRYLISWSGEYLSYGDWLAEPRRSVPFDKSRILVRQIPATPPYTINASYIEDCYLNDINSMVIFSPRGEYDLKYILGIINSRLISHWFITIFAKFQRKIFPQFKVNELAQFPIYKASKSQQKNIVKLVDKMLNLNKNFSKLTSGSEIWNNEKENLERINNNIDLEIYKLYGLTPEEIMIVKEKNEDH